LASYDALKRPNDQGNRAAATGLESRKRANRRSG